MQFDTDQCQAEILMAILARVTTAYPAPRAFRRAPRSRPPRSNAILDASGWPNDCWAGRDFWGQNDRANMMQDNLTKGASAR